MFLPPFVPDMGFAHDITEHGTTDPSSSESGGGPEPTGVPVLSSQHPNHQVGRCP